MYFQGGEHWTMRVEEAFVFSSSALALRTCIKRNFTDVHVVLKFPDGRYDLILPTVEETESMRVP